MRRPEITFGEVTSPYQLTRRDFLKIGGVGVSGLAMLGATGCNVFQNSDEGVGDGGARALNLNLGYDIPSLDTATMTDGTSFNINYSIKEGLFTLDADVLPVPAQAEGVEISDDELTYTFTLRDGIQWSNGDPVTSQNFRDAWLRVLDPETAAIYAFIFTDYVVGAAEFNAGEGGADEVRIDTPDDKTLTVELLRPVSYFLGLTAFGTFLPVNQQFVDEQGDAYAQSVDNLLFNGPYTMTEFSPQNGATLVKNPDYWNSENVSIENVNLRVVKDGNTALNFYEAGDLDRVELASEQVNRYEDSPEFEAFTVGSIQWIDFNHIDDVMANLNIRKAIQRAVDSEALAQQVLNDGSELAVGLVPTGMSGPENETFREAFGNISPEFDPQEAREFWDRGVEELGGQVPELSLLVGDTSSDRAVGTFIQGQLSENLGADIELDIQPQESQLERMRSDDYQFAWYGWYPDYNDPSAVLERFLSGVSFNYSSYSNDRFDELVTEARDERDEQARMEIFAEAEDLVINEDAAVGLQVFSGGAQLTKPYLETPPTRPFKGLDLKSFRFTDE